MSGIVKKFSCDTMSALTPAENSCICLLIYRRNASLLHRPISMMVETIRFFKYRAIARLERIECVPTSLPLKPSPFILSTVFLKCLIISSLVILCILFPIITVLTYVSPDVPLYSRTLRTMDPHMYTGHIFFPDLGCVTVMFFCLFF